MKCPFCNSKSKVIETRYRAVYNSLWRRRKCKNKECGARFSSLEFATIIPKSSGDLLKCMDK